MRARRIEVDVEFPRPSPREPGRGEAAGVTVRGRAVEPDGTPVVGATVGATRVTGELRWVLSDASGRFEIDGVKVFVTLQREVSVKVHAEGHLAGWGRSVLTDADVQADVGDVVLRFGRTIVGEVRDPQGRPVVGAVVSLVAENTGRAMRTAVSDALGAYSIECVTDGGIVVGRAPGFVGRGADPREASAWTVRSDVVLRPLHAFEGVVRDSRGNVVPDARVFVKVRDTAGHEYPPGVGRRETRTGEDGAFRLATSASPIAIVVQSRAGDANVPPPFGPNPMEIVVPAR